MSIDVNFIDLSLIDYKEAWDYQESLFSELKEIKNYNNLNENKPKEWKNYILYCEHPHVYTLGQNGDEQNLLVDYIQLQAKNASFYKINRGGDITYHGPGQIVCYPIINLNNFNFGVKSYINNLEEVIIRTLNDYGIKAERLEGATGVWIDKDVIGKARKIAAIGVRASHYITMHGFAFNINTDLKYFDHINPCGFTDKGVTSLEKELGSIQNIEEVKLILNKHFKSIFNLNIRQNNE